MFVLSDSFTDVGLDHLFAEDIGWLEDARLTRGYPDDTFRPPDSVSRQALAAHLHRAAVEIGG